jgi:hypothetical protein
MLRKCAVLTYLILLAAGVNVSAIDFTDDDPHGSLIRIYHQHIVFVDSVLDGLEPLVDVDILHVANSTVRFVRLTVRSCTLSGERSAVLRLGEWQHPEHEQHLSVHDSSFMQNIGNTLQGVDGYLVLQTGGKLLVDNTSFIGNTASNGAPLLSLDSNDAASGLKIHACTFRNNSSGRDGSCVFVTGAATSEVSNCSFENNRVAAGSGGALWVRDPWHNALPFW